MFVVKNNAPIANAIFFIFTFFNLLDVLIDEKFNRVAHNDLAKKRGDFEVHFCPPVTNQTTKFYACFQYVSPHVFLGFFSSQQRFRATMASLFVLRTQRSLSYCTLFFFILLACSVYFSYNSVLLSELFLYPLFLLLGSYMNKRKIWLQL